MRNWIEAVQRTAVNRGNEPASEAEIREACRDLCPGGGHQSRSAAAELADLYRRARFAGVDSSKPADVLVDWWEDYLKSQLPP